MSSKKELIEGIRHGNFHVSSYCSTHKITNVRSVYRRLKELSDEGKIIKIKKGRKTSYSLFDINKIAEILLSLNK